MRMEYKWKTDKINFSAPLFCITFESKSILSHLSLREQKITGCSMQNRDWLDIFVS